MKCFYHTDLDGKCSAAIVKRHWDNRALIHSVDQSTEYVPIDYSMVFPLGSVQLEETVFIVDFSLSVTDMDALLKRTNQVVWVDHHRTAIERFTGHRAMDLPGLRDISEAGCVLTWRYLFPDLSAPEAVVLVGDRDIWRWEFRDRTKFFNSGMYAVENRPEASIWSDLFKKSSYVDNVYVTNIVDNGITVERYREKWFADFRKAWMFESEIDGHKCACLNLMHTGSEAFGELEKEYPVLLLFVFNGERYKVSLYSAMGVDVGRIAEKFGGGGHPGAAGFQCDELPVHKKP